MAYASWSVVFGEQPSAAKWNILGTNDASFNDGTGIALGSSSTLGAMRNYCFRAYNSVSTTLTDATFVKILLATESYDYNNNFASSTYTAPVAGVYHFNGSVTYATAVATPVQALSMIYVNGVAAINGGNYLGITGGSPIYQVTGDILLAASDTVELYHYQDSAGNEATQTGSASTFLAGHIVRAT